MRKLIFIGPMLLLIVWFIISWTGVVDSFFLPGPIETFVELYNLLINDTLLDDLVSTLKRTVITFGISGIIGIPLGLILAASEKVYRSIEFIIDFFRSTPATAIFPLFLLIFGVTDMSKIAIASFAALMYVLFSTAYGVIHAKQHRILAARIMGATKLQIFRKILLFESLPHVFVGLKNAISVSLVIIVITEMFIGTESGLGHRIIDFQSVYNVTGMYATILITGVLGYLLNFVLLTAEKRLLHWSTK